MDRMSTDDGERQPQSGIVARSLSFLGLPREAALILLLVSLAYWSWVIWCWSFRIIPGYGTETDFLGHFVPEGKRFLEGSPLLSRFHPPLYSMLLSGAKVITGDWFRAGLILAAVSGFAALLAGFATIRAIYGSRYGIGALLALIAAPSFLIYSVTASSDTPFLAMFLGAIYFGVLTLRSPRFVYSMGCGILIGSATLIRTNGVTLILLAILPLIAATPWATRWRHTFIILLSAAFPIALMILFAAVTGSSIMPRGTVDNMAMTFYSGSTQLVAEYFWKVEGRFRSPLDVLLHDPVHVAKIYANNLLDLATTDVPRLIASPLNLLFLTGLFVLAIHRSTPVAMVLIVILLLQIALLNLKDFEPRYFLFIVPFLGAGLFEVARWIQGRRREPHRLRWGIGLVLLVSIVGVGVAKAALDARKTIAKLDDEPQRLFEQGVWKHVKAGSAVVARKPQLAYFASARDIPFPHYRSMSSLHRGLETFQTKQPVYLFFGEFEHRLRPELRSLSDPKQAPVWLEPVAANSKDRWALYRYVG